MASATAPPHPGLASGSDAGLSPSNDISQTATPTVSGTGTVVGVLEQSSVILVCLGSGEFLSKFDLLPFPGPVIGLILLLLYLCYIGTIPQAMDVLADNILVLLGMLFVPAGVGVLAYRDLLQAERLPILAAVVGGTVVTLIVTTFVSGVLTATERPQEDLARSEISDAPI